jgi:DNA polymerase I-like protein with 3'-5' exonuclease and polymerase domains
LTGVKDAWRAFLIEDTVQKHAVLYSDMPHDLNFLGSLYASINRWKHLAGSYPEIYAGCDALGTWEVDVALERELSADPRSRVVWEQIDRPAIEIFTEAQYAGLRTNPERVKAVAGMLEEETRDAQARATAACGWPINIGSPPQVAHRLFNVEKLKLPRAPR